MADWNGPAFRRRLRSAERRSDSAIARGLRSVNTSFSRSSALLCSVTFRDQRRGLGRARMHQSMGLGSTRSTPPRRPPCSRVRLACREAQVAGPHAFVGGRILTMDPWRATAEVAVIEKGRIAAQAAREPGARWVRGAGWDETAGGLVPDRHALDALGFDRPVLVAHYSLHQCVVSSQALDELGIGRTTPDPPGGTIARGPDGEPTGLLVERAWSEAHARSLAAYRDPARWGGLIAALARALVADGITCVHDAACPPSAESVYRTLAGAGALPVSVLMMPHGEALLTAPSAARLEGPLTGEGDERLRVGPIKLFADGGIAPALDVTIQGQRARYGVCFADLP